MQTTPRRRTRLRAPGLAVALTALLAACGTWVDPPRAGGPPVGVPALTVAPAGARSFGPSTWWRTSGPSGAWMTMEKHDAPGPGRHPTVVIFPGTSGLSIEQQLLAELFAQRGITAVAVCWFKTEEWSPGINCPNGPAPLGVSEQLLPDMNALVAAVKRLPGVDPDRVALYGGSRGGGIVALVATQGGPEPVVSVSGLMDPSTFPTLPSETDVVARAAGIRAPVFLAYGVEDTFVNWRTNSVPLANAITAAHVAPAPVLRGYAGGHSPDYFSIDAFPDAPQAPQLLDDVVAFLNRTLTGAVAVAARPGGGAYVLYGNGRVVPVAGAPAYGGTEPMWPGSDIARDIAVMPDGGGYVVLDGLGGLHRFGSATSLPAVTGASWNWDIARAVAITPSGNGVVVLDGWGGLHRAGDAPAYADADPGASWPGQDVARDVAITPDGAGVVVLDRSGGVHRAGSATATVPVGAPNADTDARALVLTPSGAGYGIVTTRGITVAGDAPAPPALAAGDWRGLALTTGGWLAVRADRALAPSS